MGSKQLAILTQIIPSKASGKTDKAITDPGIGLPLDVMDVAKFHGYARVMVDRSPQPAFYFKTLPPLNFSHRQSSSRRAGGGDVQRPLPGLPFLHRLHQLEPETAVGELFRATPDAFQNAIE